MGGGGGGFEFFLSVGAGVFRSLGSFTLVDVVVLGGLLCLTSTLFFWDSLWEDFCRVFFLEVSANSLMDYNLLSPMDVNAYVGAGFVIVSIKYSEALGSASWLDTPGILLCSGKNSTGSTMCSALVLLTYTLWTL